MIPNSDQKINTNSAIYPENRFPSNFNQKKVNKKENENEKNSGKRQKTPDQRMDLRTGQRGKKIKKEENGPKSKKERQKRPFHPKIGIKKKKMGKARRENHKKKS